MVLFNCNKLIYNSKQFIDGLINSGYLKVAHNTLLNYNENMSARSKDFFDAYYRYPEYKDMATYYLHRLREEALASWN